MEGLAGSVGSTCDSGSRRCEFKPHTGCREDFKKKKKKRKNILVEWEWDGHGPQI